MKSLSLINSDFIANSEVREAADRLRSTSMSYLTLINGNDWQTKDRRPFLPISRDKHLAMKYKRLVSVSGNLLLPRVTAVQVYDPNTAKMVSPSEPRIELF